MSSKARLRERGLLPSLAEIRANGPKTEWQHARLARASHRLKDPQVQSRAERWEKKRAAFIIINDEDAA